MAKQERKNVTKMSDRFFKFILASYFLSQLFFMFQSLAVFTASVRSRSALWRHLQEIWKVFVFEDLGLWAVLGMFLFLFLFLMKGKWSRNWVWGQGFCPALLKIHDFHSNSESKTHDRQLWAISIGWDAPMEAELEGWAVLGATVRAQLLPGRSCRTYLPCPASLVLQCLALSCTALPC